MKETQNPLPVSECRICSHLRDTETSFVKFGADEQNTYLPDAAKELEEAEDTRVPGKDRHHVKRCPVCGRLYKYDLAYEYLVNGSEDEETLTRLTPAETRRFWAILAPMGFHAPAAPPRAHAESDLSRPVDSPSQGGYT